MTDTPRPLTVREITWDEGASLARDANVHLPIEQTQRWARFEEAAPGRLPWRLLAIDDDAGNTVATAAFAEYSIRGNPYLWAKHGPVWLADADVRLERAARDALVSYCRAAHPRALFLRLHAHDKAPDLHELVNTVTYDRTVVVDLTVSADKYLASRAKKFRYAIRQSLGQEQVYVKEETGLDRHAFDELYAVYEETAARDGFGIYDADVYWAMLEHLGDAARVFVARTRDAEFGSPGRALAWLIATVSDNRAIYYFAAGSAEARRVDASLRVLWECMAVLRTDGVATIDLMGVDSARAPGLAGVGLFKRKWGEEVAVDAAWDLPLRAWRYRLLSLAAAAKRLRRRQRTQGRATGATPG